MPKQITVVLAESHRIQRKNFCLLLEFETDIEVIGETGNFEEALKLAQDGHPDVLIVDLSTQLFSGTEILSRTTESLHSTRVLGITQYDDEDYINKLFIAGATGLILKDTAIACLVEAVRLVGRGSIYISPEILASWEKSCKPAMSHSNKSPRILKTRKSYLAISRISE